MPVAWGGGGPNVRAGSNRLNWLSGYEKAGGPVAGGRGEAAPLATAPTGGAAGSRPRIWNAAMLAGAFWGNANDAAAKGQNPSA